MKQCKFNRKIKCGYSDSYCKDCKIRRQEGIILLTSPFFYENKKEK